MIAVFQQAMSDAGLGPGEPVVPDGMLHRFSVTGDKPGSGNGWYIMHGDKPQAGAFGSWKTGASHKWSAKNPESMTSGERVAYNAQIDEFIRKRQEIENQRHADCRQKAEAIWTAAQDASMEHPYLITKQVKPHGIRESGDDLIVPVMGSDGVLHGLQFIQQNGVKRFLPGTAVKGSYFTIGEIANKVLICEGYATGATLHEVTGEAVVVAFNAGNLKPVAEALRMKMHGVVLMICADDDYMTEGNPGMTKATEAAKAVNGKLAVPVFPGNRGARDSDFNDLFRLAGGEAVKGCVEKTPDEWCDPEPFKNPDPVEIPATSLPGYLGEYAAALSRNAQTPEGLAVSVILGVLATAVQKKFEIAPKNGGYREPLSLWTACILPSGGGKTGIFQRVVKPLLNWESAEAALMHDEIVANIHLRDFAHRRIESLKTKASKSGNMEEAMAEILEIEKNTPKSIIAPRLFTDDTTPETLQMLLALYDEKMGLISDEGGIFAVMAGIYTNGQFNNNVFLKGHAGATTRTDRMTRNVALEHPALSFAMGLQPTVFVDMSPIIKKKFRGSGLFARFLYFLPVSTVGKRAADNDYEIPNNIQQEFDYRLNNLLNIPTKRDVNGRIEPTILTLAPEAKMAWIKFWAYIEARMDADKNGDLIEMKDWGGKLPGAAARIAGVLHIAMTGGSSTIIELPVMRSALNIAEALISHAQALFGMIENGPDEIDAHDILKWIRFTKFKEFTLRDAKQRFKTMRPVDERVSAGLKVLARRHYISELITIKTGGRDSYVHKVNPAVVEGMA
jgi:putative DNA primase/helicase